MKKILLIFFLIPLISYSQSEPDSLWDVWIDENEPDTARLKALSNYNIKKYLSSQPDSAFILAEMQYEFASKKNRVSWMGTALRTQGISLRYLGEFKNAISYYQKALILFEELKDTTNIAETIRNLGICYKNLGEYDKAEEYYLQSEALSKRIGDIVAVSNAQNNLGNLYTNKGELMRSIQYHTQALTTREINGDEKLVAASLQNIGNVYYTQGEYSKALDHYSRSQVIFVKLNNMRGMSINLNNMANIYHRKMKDYVKALECLNQSLAIRKEMGNKQGVASCLVNIGVLYDTQGKLDQAYSYLTEALTLSEEIGDQYKVALLLRVIGGIYSKKGKNVKAREFLNKSFELAQKIEALEIIILSAEELLKYHLEDKNYEKAFEVYKVSVAARDSLYSAKSKDELVKQEFKHKYEIQAAADSIKILEADKIKDAQLAAEKAENKQNKQEKYFLFGGLALALLFGGFIFNRFQITKKQKGIIEEQKLKVDFAYEELEEKNKEITDSIAYAKRIQYAILPPIKLVKSYLKDFFVLYKPKDVVSGDFYWMLPEANDGSTLFAAADCTGHGVPGAMVSVICNSALNRSVKEFSLTEPGEILTKTRELVIEEFEKSDEKVQDGMDIALCSLKGNVLKYAGAYNPLWIIRNGAAEVEEIKAHKQAIGLVENSTDFPSHEIKLQKGDTFYIFSDGFVDQFGGEKGKKFKTPNFRKLLLAIQAKSLEEQHQLIENSFEAWRGDLEQVDDVCVIGVRV